MKSDANLEAIYAGAFAPYDRPLRAGELMEEAARAVGVADWGGKRWGEDGFRKRLHALCESLETESNLSPIGRTRAHGRLHTMLCSRLRMIQWRKDGAAERPIVKPLIGTGLARAGTSFLHQLLAQDPENQSASTAESTCPVPPPGDPVVDAERQALTTRMLDFQGLLSPEVEAVHPFAADAPDECSSIQEHACSTLYLAFWNVPSFLKGANADVDDLLEWEKGVLQVLQSQRSAARWVLKWPDYLQHWDAMWTAFPDAMVFLNHRDPAKTIASAGSLLTTFRGLNSHSVLDPKLLGPAMLAGTMAHMDHVAKWRAAHPQVTVVDVHYKQLVADPIGEVERLYASFGLSLTPRARERMESFLKINRHGQGKAHRYDLADIGLDEAMVEEICGKYIDTFGIARERRN
jgi:hypothetical protein